MAKASVRLTCKVCGCGFTHERKCYNRSEAENYEEWATENITVCPDCYKKESQKAAQAAAESTGITAEITDGSEKQIAWAQKIRARVTNELHKMIKPEKWNEVANAINSKTSARWWIDAETSSKLTMAHTAVKTIMTE